MYGQDKAEMTGSLALYLVQEKADFLEGSLTSVNWDLEEMEARKEDIEKRLLKVSWMPVLPVSGGKGFWVFY